MSEKRNGAPASDAPPPDGAVLMLLDTYGLVYRAFFALPTLTTTKGFPINAAYGFTQMLTKIIGDEKPTHVIACFDKGMPQARVALYSEYKAQRDAMPDVVLNQLYRFTAGENGFTAKTLWGGRQLSNDVCSSLLHDGAVYGFDIQQAQASVHRPARGRFKCLDFATGQVRPSSSLILTVRFRRSRPSGSCGLTNRMRSFSPSGRFEGRMRLPKQTGSGSDSS